MELTDLLIPYKNLQVPNSHEEMDELPIFNLNKQIAQVKAKIEPPKMEDPPKKLLTWVLYAPYLLQVSEVKIPYAAPESTPSSIHVGEKVTKILLENSEGFKTFNTAYDNYLKKHPEDNDPNMRIILANIAAHESRYTPNAKNATSSAFGYFLMIDSTRKSYSNLSKEEFARNPEALIEAAVKMYKTLLEKYINPNQKQLQQRGIDLASAIYGYWFRPASMNNYLKTGADDYSDPLGTKLTKVWESYKKLGGILWKQK